MIEFFFYITALLVFSLLFWVPPKLKSLVLFLSFQFLGLGFAALSSGQDTSAVSLVLLTVFFGYWVFLIYVAIRLTLFRKLGRFDTRDLNRLRY